MCGVAAVVVGAAVVGSQLYASRQARKEAQRNRDFTKKQAEEERRRIKEGTARINEAFESPDVDAAIGRNSSDVLDIGTRLANERFDARVDRLDVKNAQRGLFGPLARSRRDRLKRLLASERGRAGAAADRFKFDTKARLDSLRRQLIGQVSSGGVAPTTEAALAQQHGVISEAASGYTPNVVSGLVDVGTTAVNTDTQARASGNRGIAELDFTVRR